MFTVFLRVIIIYSTVLLFLRLMGKRQIGEMQPYEVVITLIIADLATLPMSDTNIPLLNGILPLAVLVVLHFAITFSTRKSLFLRKVFSGKPVVVISPNGIEYENLRELNMNIDDLQESIRLCNYYSFDQVQYAIVETNGKMSIIPTSDAAPATAQDVKVKNPPPVLPSIIVSDGKIVKEKLQEQDLTIDFVKKFMKKMNIKKIDDITIMSIDEDNKMYLQLKGKKFQVIYNVIEKLKKQNKVVQK